MCDLYSGSSFISQPVQEELDGKVSLVSSTTQSIGSGLDVSGNINLSAGSEFQINGVPIGGGSNLPTIDTLVITESGIVLSQTDITYITGYTLTGFIALLVIETENVPAGKTKTIIAQELNGKMVRIGIPLASGNIISPLLTKNGQQQTFLWDGTKWTYDDNKITANLLGWGAERGVINNNNLTIQSELQESGDINLLTGKKYKINSVNLEAVAETLSNKTISGSSNTILNLPISSSTGLQTALDGKVALVSATKQTIGSSIDVSGNINLPTGSQYQINGVSITAGGGGGGTPGGVEGSVQYNASGAFAGESDFNYSASTNTLTLTNGTLKPTKILFDNDKVIINGLTTETPSAGIFTTAVGPQAGLTNQANLATAIGKSAGETNQGNSATAIGVGAGGSSQQPFAVAIGYSAGLLTQGASAIAIGNSAAGFYQGENSIAIGKLAGDNQAVNSICINATGLRLSNDIADTCVVAPIRTQTDLTGLNSVYYNTTTKEMVTGVQSGGGGGSPAGVDGSVQFNSGGAFAGESDFRYIASMKTLMLTDGTIETKQLNFDGINNINIGVRQNATDDGQRDDAIAIGTGSGLLNQSRKAIAIGLYAGVAYQQEDSIAIGSSSGDTQSYSTIAIGTRCGNNQREFSIAIGYEAGGGAGGFQSADSIAIGYRAGGTQQQSGSVAIGLNAGKDGQQQTAVAIGANAGNYSQRGNSIAIGNKAGANVQGRFNLEGNNIAIGYEAGNDNQAPHAIAIGYQAGKSYQAPNSICINATGIQLDNQTENTCVIKPIRNETNLSGFLQLYYNPSTGELVYN